MRIIAIETSGRHGSLAVLTGSDIDAQVLGEKTLEGTQRTAQSLAPALRDLLREVKCPPASIELVAVTVGPGSFTGLRIGVTTAKAFAYAIGAEIIGVIALEVLASQAPQSQSPLWTIMDAQRQELFAARFDASGSSLTMTRATHIVPQDQWLAGLQAGERATGPALRRLASRLPAGVLALPEVLWEPKAAAAGRLAWQIYRAGHRDDVWKLSPLYYRPSAAEEIAARREEES